MMMMMTVMILITWDLLDQCVAVVEDVVAEEERF